MSKTRVISCFVGDCITQLHNVDGSEIRLTSWYGKYPSIYRLSYMLGGWPRDFWTINSRDYIFHKPLKNKGSVGSGCQAGCFTRYQDRYLQYHLRHSGSPPKQRNWKGEGFEGNPVKRWRRGVEWNGLMKLNFMCFFWCEIDTETKFREFFWWNDMETKFRDCFLVGTTVVCAKLVGVSVWWQIPAVAAQKAEQNIRLGPPFWSVKFQQKNLQH